MRTGKNPNTDWELSAPDASAMIEALRGVGYSLPTALADIVDNSVSALARLVRIDFSWAGQHSWVRVADDGHGMDAVELSSAMRLGAKHPLDTRDQRDLGRFGLGLKTASFSQCRRLTVASSRHGQISIRRWDLDHIAKVREWQLFMFAAPESVNLINVDAAVAGTCVLWEVLDRVPGPYAASRAKGEGAFLEAIDQVERHLAMVFHRYLSDQSRPLRILLNGVDIQPWDPFVERHPATIRRPVERLQTVNGPLEVQGFILPHRDRLEGDQWERAAGPDGWTAQQGFYVYRNRRLLVAGSWLGLGTGQAWTKEEAHKLARLRLDIENSSDGDWKIDIKKSTASPPQELRPRLRELAEDVRAEARRVFAHRGSYGTSRANAALVHAWIAREVKGAVTYRIDRKHPVVSEVISRTNDQAALLEAMLAVIEQTVPVQKIWLDAVEKGEVQGMVIGDAPSQDVSTMLEAVYAGMRSRIGLPAAQAKHQLLCMEPFSRYPDLVNALPEDN